MHRLNLYGLVGLLGASAFTLSLTVLHLERPEIDWRRDYVSHFVHGNLGWLFVSAAVFHGFANLTLGWGLRGSLMPGRLQRWAVFLFGVAAVGIVLSGLLPTDPTGVSPTVKGLAHRDVVHITFLGQLLALLLFSVAFARDPRWRQQSGTSFMLFAIAAVALAGFVGAVVMGWMLGLAERLALASFIAWDFWSALHLMNLPSASRNA